MVPDIGSGVHRCFEVRRKYEIDPDGGTRKKGEGETKYLNGKSILNDIQWMSIY